ncbi:MAG: hypothetical protein LBM96_10900 [Methanobrevibacter sp.]|jgi:hypothetical protein|nr:hypothetical protein [Candidatus Methanoflexus mossambicus]
MTTKKEIRSIILKGHVTAIHRIAAKCGVDADIKSDVYNFLLQNCNSKKMRDTAYQMAFNRDVLKKQQVTNNTPKTSKISEAIAWAKFQKKAGFGENYLKILVLGDKNIYWASPIFKHRDYNKSIAMPNSDRNKKVIDIINNYLLK